MTKAPLSPSRSHCKALAISAAVRCAVLLLMAVACGPDAGSERFVDTGSSATVGNAPSTSISRRIPLLTPLPVDSIGVTAQRLDLVLRSTGMPANPDSEQVTLARVANAIWDDQHLAIRPETIAIAVARQAQPLGAIERNTYFFYRSRRPSGQQ